MPTRGVDIARINGTMKTAFSIVFWIVSLTPSSLGLGPKPQSQTAKGTVSPIWRLDLRSVGFTGFEPKQETWGLHLRPNPLCFSDSKVLIATFITREEVTTLARRKRTAEPLPLRLHGIFMDADAGKVEATKEWPITRPRGGIIAAGDGKFAVVAPALIALHSPSLELVKDLKLSSVQQSDLWDFHSSPSGKSIVAEYHTPEAYFQWIDTNSLTPRPVSIDTVLFSISDNEVAVRHNPYVKPQGFLEEVLIRTGDDPWRTICYVPAGRVGNCGRPQFLSNDVLALLMPHRFSLLPRTGGDEFSKVSFPDDEWLDRPFYPSSDGKRFAVTVWKHEGGSAFFDVSSHSVLKRIVVYDIPKRQEVYAFDAKSLNVKSASGVALSPDGSRLALLTEGVVQVYQLLFGQKDAVDAKGMSLGNGRPR